jgi:hypothetical protein
MAQFIDTLIAKLSHAEIAQMEEGETITGSLS